MGLVPSQKKPQKSLNPPTMRGHSKMRALYEPGSRPLPDINAACALTLDFLASETMRNTDFAA